MSAWRILPPVVTPISARDLVQAAGAIVRAPSAVSALLAASLRDTYGRPVLALTDSATSALVYVLSRVARADDVVAIPGFGCIDVAAAVQGAGLRAIPYDIDPISLAPDGDSLRSALHDGARVVIASHLFGFAVPLEHAQSLCDEFGALLIEDAAQAFGASWNGTMAGAIGTLSVLSFGRGKGIGGGGGGAVLGVLPAPANAPVLSGKGVSSIVDEFSALARSAIMHLIARPAVYALPASMPSLRLGEMVYHRAHAPTGMTRVAASLARSGLLRMRDGVSARVQRARRLVAAARAGRRCRPLEPSAGSEATWLRAPMLLESHVAAPTALGVYRAYPRAVPEQHKIADILLRPLPSLPGAVLLASQLVTFPTHSRLAERDLRALERWLTSDHDVA